MDNYHGNMSDWKTTPEVNALQEQRRSEWQEGQYLRTPSFGQKMTFEEYINLSPNERLKAINKGDIEYGEALDYEKGYQELGPESFRHLTEPVQPLPSLVFDTTARKFYPEGQYIKHPTYDPFDRRPIQERFPGIGDMSPSKYAEMQNRERLEQMGEPFIPPLNSQPTPELQPPPIARQLPAPLPDGKPAGGRQLPAPLPGQQGLTQAIPYNTANQYHGDPQMGPDGMLYYPDGSIASPDGMIVNPPTGPQHSALGGGTAGMSAVDQYNTMVGNRDNRRTGTYSSGAQVNPNTPPAGPYGSSNPGRDQKEREIANRYGPYTGIPHPLSQRNDVVESSPGHGGQVLQDKYTKWETGKVTDPTSPHFGAEYNTKSHYYDTSAKLVRSNDDLPPKNTTIIKDPSPFLPKDPSTFMPSQGTPQENAIRNSVIQPNTAGRGFPATGSTIPPTVQQPVLPSSYGSGANNAPQANQGVRVSASLNIPISEFGIEDGTEHLQKLYNKQRELMEQGLNSQNNAAARALRQRAMQLDDHISKLKQSAALKTPEQLEADQAGQAVMQHPNYTKHGSSTQMTPPGQMPGYTIGGGRDTTGTQYQDTGGVNPDAPLFAPGMGFGTPPLGAPQMPDGPSAPEYTPPAFPGEQDAEPMVSQDMYPYPPADLTNPNKQARMLAQQIANGEAIYRSVMENETIPMAIKSALAQLDANGNGYLSKKELKEADSILGDIAGVIDRGNLPRGGLLERLRANREERRNNRGR